MKMAVFRREMAALGQLFPHPAEDSEIEVQEENQEGKNNSSAGAAKQGA